MSNVLIEKNTVDLLANAISDKSGVPVTMTLGEMIEAVDSIEANPAPTLQAKTYTVDSAGTETVTADSGYDGLSEVEVSVPSAEPYIGINRWYSTESGAEKFNMQPTVMFEDDGDIIGTAGWMGDNTNGDTIKYDVIPRGTTITPTESTQTIGGRNYMMDGAVTVNAIPSNYVGSGITQRSSSDLTASGATVTVPSGYYSAQASKAVSSGSATPASTISATGASVSTGTNTLTLSKTVSNTPTVSAGYVSSGTAGNSSVSLTASVTTQAAQTIYPSTSDQTIAASRYLTGAQTIKAVTTSNLSAENIKSGVTITVGDSADADRVASVTGTYTGGGGSVNIDTKTVTASEYPVSISFTSMNGEPKAFFLRSTSQISSSGSTTYYYIIDMRYDGGTNHYCNGNCFRIGSTRRVDPISTTATGGVVSGYSWSYSGTTLTITSSAASRSASPGAFNNGYELVYVY